MSKQNDEWKMHQALLEEELLHFMQGRMRKPVERQKMPEAWSILPKKRSQKEVQKNVSNVLKDN